jgi:ABC-type amino acid transport substrate-binding protein
MFRIPADTFQLFLASGVVNSRFGTLVAAMHTLAVALLGTCAMTGALTWNRARLVRYLTITVVLTIGVIGGSRLLFARALHHAYSKDKVLAGMHLLHEPVRAVVHKAGDAGSVRTPPPEGGARLDIIRRRGVLTVGYLADSLPYAFFNAAGDLVGLDVELAHRLAAELSVSLEFVPLDRGREAEQVNAGECDIVMSGVAVTTMRASRMLFSTAYLDETMAFIAPDGQRTEFATWDQLRRRPGLRLGIPDIPYYIQKVRDRLPNATLEVLPEFTTFFTSEDSRLDALVFAAERGSAWTLMYPKFAVVIPEPDVVKVPLAYPIGQRDQALATFVNTWIELKRKDGTLDALYKYWILGLDATPRQPRWSIMRDVLGWTR